MVATVVTVDTADTEEVLVWPSPVMEQVSAEVPDLAVDSQLVLEPLPPFRVVPPAWDPVVLVLATLLVPRRLLELQEFNKSFPEE